MPEDTKEEAQAVASTPEVEPEQGQAEPQSDIDWKAQARKWESQAKANKEAAARLAEFEAADKARREAEMTEVQKAEAAREEAAKEAEALRAELAINKAAVAHGLTPEDAEALQGVPLDRIEALAARLASTKSRFQGTPDAGPRNADLGSQITREQLAAMTPEQRVEALDKGLLGDLLAGR